MHKLFSTSMESPVGAFIKVIFAGMADKKAIKIAPIIIKIPQKFFQ